MPPFGYAVLIVRNLTRESIPLGRLARSLAPYLIAQLAVLLLTLAWPGMLMRHGLSVNERALPNVDDHPQTVEQQLEQNAIESPVPDNSGPDAR